MPYWWQAKKTKELGMESRMPNPTSINEELKNNPNRNLKCEQKKEEELRHEKGAKRKINPPKHGNKRHLNDA